MDRGPPGSSAHGDSPGQNIGVGLLCPLPGDLPNPGIEPRSPTLQADSLLSEPPGRLLSIPMLSVEIVLILPPASVLFAPLSAQGTYANGLHFKHTSTCFFHIPQHLTQGLAENTMLSTVSS